MVHGSKARRSSIFLTIALVCASAFSTKPAAAAPQGVGGQLASTPQPFEQVSAGDVRLLPGPVSLDGAQEGAILGALVAAQDLLGNAADFAVTDLRSDGDWALASVVGFPALDPAMEWHAEDGSWFGMVLISHDGDAWSAAVRGTYAFEQMLAGAPESLLDVIRATAADTASTGVRAASQLNFPWPAGTAMIYGPLGIHEGGSGRRAVDFASDGNTSAGHASGVVQTAEAGTISYVCRDGISSTIIIGNFLYAHLLDNPGLYVGRRLAQGEVLGELKHGSFSAACGYATQPSNWFHLHWAFPNADLYVEDWVLSMSTGLWTNGSTTVAPGSGWITPRSTAAAADCSSLTYDGVMLFSNEECGSGGIGSSESHDAPGVRLDLISSMAGQASSIHVGSGWSIKVYAEAAADAGESWRCVSETVPQLSTINFDHGDTSRSVNDSVLSLRVFHNDSCASAPADFDANGASDTVIYRGGAWHFYEFATGAYTSGEWTGAPGGSCLPAPMDYDGDGAVEMTQLCGADWYFYKKDGSLLKRIATGTSGGVPVPADYNGDGIDEPVVFERGAWKFYDLASAAYLAGSSRWTGLPGGGGRPAPMDYDGDGDADLTFLSDGGAWHFYNSNGSYYKGIWIGRIAGQLPVPGDYDGNGIDEPVIFRGGAWLFYHLATGAYMPGRSVWTGAPAPLAGGATVPAPLDYNGDGRLDLSVHAGGPWHFFNADGTYNRGIWTGKAANDKVISRRVLP